MSCAMRALSGGFSLTATYPCGPRLSRFLALAYVIFPLDFIPDALLGLGQLDDLTIVLLGLKAFIGLSPADIVAQYRTQAAPGGLGRDAEHRRRFLSRAR